MADTFKIKDALVTFGFGVVVPSADVYTDIALSVKLLLTNDDTWKGEIQYLFGWIIWIPIIINLLFTIPHWRRVEKT